MRKQSNKKSVPRELPYFKENTEISLTTFKLRPTHFALKAIKGETIMIYKKIEDEIPFFSITPWRERKEIAEDIIETEDD
jgi:hypothetical protein